MRWLKSAKPLKKKLLRSNYYLFIYMKLGEQWSQSQTYRRLKEKGSVTFHVLSNDVKKTVTFFDNGKPIRQGDPMFETRMAEWEALVRERYAMKDKKDTPEYKELDEKIYKVGPAIKYFLQIINRATEEKEVLEMTPGAAKKLNDLFLKGYTTVSHDYILENTGGTGVNKYTVLPAPVKKPLTEKELKSTETEELEEVNPDDIPF